MAFVSEMLIFLGLSTVHQQLTSEPSSGVVEQYMAARDMALGLLTSSRLIPGTQEEDIDRHSRTRKVKSLGLFD